MWRVDGKVWYRKTVNVEGVLADKYVFTMPDVPTDTVLTIEVEVNPGRNRPQGEASWVNNKSRTTLTADNPEPQSGGGLGDIYFSK